MKLKLYPLFKLAKKFFYFLNIEQIKRRRISELQKMGPEGTDWVEFGQKPYLPLCIPFTLDSLLSALSLVQNHTMVDHFRVMVAESRFQNTVRIQCFSKKCSTSFLFVRQQLAQVQWVHESADLWDITFCTETKDPNSLCNCCVNSVGHFF